MIPLRKILTGPHGYHVVFDTEGPLKENDTFTCGHHGGIEIVENNNNITICRRCGERVCDICAPRGKCDPLTNPNRWELMDAIESKFHNKKVL